MKRYAIVVLLMMLAIGIAYSDSARVQNKTKRTVSKIHFHSKWITPPVEYSFLKVRDKRSEFSSMFEEGNEKLEKPLSSKTEFEEDDDFWEHLSFDVTNVSDKTIVYLKTYIYLYTREGVESGSFDTSMAIEFGNPSKFDPPHEESLKPGESKTLTVSEFYLNFAQQQARQLRSPIVRAGIYAESVYFADGYYWTFDGKIFPPKSKNRQSSLKNPVDRKSNIFNASVDVQKKSSCDVIIAALRKSPLGLDSFGFNLTSVGLAALSGELSNSISRVSPIKRPSFDNFCLPGCFTINGNMKFSCDPNDPDSDCKGTRSSWLLTDPNDQNGFIIKAGPPAICKFPNQPPNTQCALSDKVCVSDRKCPRPPGGDGGDGGTGCGFDSYYSCQDTLGWLDANCVCHWDTPILIDVLYR